MLNRTIAILLLIGAGWLLVDRVNDLREMGRAMECTNNLKQLALAMQNFHVTYKRLPEPFRQDLYGNKSQEHSWRIAMMPFIESSSLYDDYTSSKSAWNSRANFNVMRSVPYGYRCPSRVKPDEEHGRYFIYDEGSKKSNQTRHRKELLQTDLASHKADGGHGLNLAAYDFLPIAYTMGQPKGYNPDRLPVTDYIAITGEETAMNPMKTTSFDDVKDPHGSTILVMETARSDRFWTEPRDLDIETFLFHPQMFLHCHPRRPGFFMKPVWGGNVAMVDGSVRWIPTDTPPEELRAMLTINGGEAVALKQVMTPQRTEIDTGRVASFSAWWAMLLVLIVRRISSRKRKRSTEPIAPTADV